MQQNLCIAAFHFFLYYGVYKAPSQPSLSLLSQSLSLSKYESVGYEGNKLFSPCSPLHTHSEHAQFGEEGGGGVGGAEREHTNGGGEMKDEGRGEGVEVWWLLAMWSGETQTEYI